MTAQTAGNEGGLEPGQYVLIKARVDADYGPQVAVLIDDPGLGDMAILTRRENIVDPSTMTASVEHE